MQIGIVIAIDAQSIAAGSVTVDENTRVTEDGETRITEDDQTRAIED